MNQPASLADERRTPMHAVVVRETGDRDAIVKLESLQLYRVLAHF